MCLFNFMRNCNHFFQSGLAILHPINKYKSSGGSISWSTFDVVIIFTFNHSGRCTILPPCGSHLLFSDE